jgi:hypothetical protein
MQVINPTTFGRRLQIWRVVCRLNQAAAEILLSLDRRDGNLARGKPFG